MSRTAALAGSRCAVDPADHAAADEPPRAAWRASRDTHHDIAAGLRREGPGLGLPEGFAELLRAELAETRRVGNNGNTQGRMRDDCDADDELRADCRSLLATCSEA